MLISVNNLFNYFIFLSVDVYEFGHISALLHNKFDLGFCGGSQYFSVIGVYDALDGFVVAIAGVVGAWGYDVGLFVSGLLSSPRGLNSIEIFLIEPSIFADAVLPLVGVLIS